MLLYESLGIEIALRDTETDTVFWNAAALGTPTEGIKRKPNKRIFDLALEKAGLPPDEVWYIGDQFECDVKGSLNAGLLPVWYIGAVDMPYKLEEGQSMEESHFMEKGHSTAKNILTVADWNELRRQMEALT